MFASDGDADEDYSVFYTARESLCGGSKACPTVKFFVSIIQHQYRTKPSQIGKPDRKSVV